jgi:hypothetical protein
MALKDFLKLQKQDIQMFRGRTKELGLYTYLVSSTLFKENALACQRESDIGEFLFEWKEIIEETGLHPETIKKYLMFMEDKNLLHAIEKPDCIKIIIKNTSLFYKKKSSLIPNSHRSFPKENTWKTNDPYSNVFEAIVRLPDISSKFDVNDYTKWINGLLKQYSITAKEFEAIAIDWSQKQLKLKKKLLRPKNSLAYAVMRFANDKLMREANVLQLTSGFMG